MIILNIDPSGLYCHSEFLGRKVSDIEQFDWSTIDLEAVVNRTVYPLSKTQSGRLD
ncbi:MAG: hypothetical protein NTV00_16785 [Methylococcales bacterium]|nr:hypothetical protein [Methylococcales bacterium]